MTDSTNTTNATEEKKLDEMFETAIMVSPPKDLDEKIRQAAIDAISPNEEE